MAEPTYAELLSAAKSALARVMGGAKTVVMNGREFHYSSIQELKDTISWLEVKVAEENGTDGRGAWEATFND